MNKAALCATCAVASKWLAWFLVPQSRKEQKCSDNQISLRDNPGKSRLPQLCVEVTYKLERF